MFVHKRDGFTLIEMMVVVGIAAVLSAFAAPAFDQWTENQNCVIDAGETVAVVRVESGLNWGVAIASAGVPTAFGSGPIGTGSSFSEPNDNPATWVLFRPDGTPVAFAPDCTIGAVGSGSGAAYLTSGAHDYAAVVTALGGIRVHAWENQSGQWTN